MIDYKYKDLFLDNSIPKQVTISFDNVVLTNEDLYNQEMTLEENLCSEEELRFGSCESSILSFKISDVFSPMAGKWLDVKMTIDKNTDSPFLIGKYKVNSDKLSGDKSYREIVAYDAMYDIINSSAIKWYNTILPHKDSKVTMKQFRTSFIHHFGLEQEEIELINDDIIIEKTIQVEEDIETEQVSVINESALSGLDVIKAICEINGCFGHIGRDGKFHYIYLQQNIQGLYPADNLFPDHAPDYLPQAKTGHLFPQDPKSNRIGKPYYIECSYEDFVTKSIDKLQIRQEENDIGQVWPEAGLRPEDNCYIIENNFLVYGKFAAELRVIAKNIYEKIHEVSYRPFECDAIGNPCLEIGDSIRILTKRNIVESYVLQRTLKGTQALRDSLRADGVEKYAEKVNGIQSSIIQLKGKTNILERNVDETRLEMRDMGEELSTEISVTAAGINETIKNTKEGLETKISKTVRSIEMSVSNNKTGKTAEVKLLITDEGGTQYEVTADKIDLTGLVSFTNLETGGQTIINGNNITTGQINCDLLNGGKILGQTIEGGRINGTIIKAKDGIYLQYINPIERPPGGYEFAFAEVEAVSSGINGSVININAPSGETCISIGYGGIPAPNMVFYPVSFPKGAMINGAVISEALIQSVSKESASANFFYSSDIPGDVAEATFNLKTSGVFNTIYGKYYTNKHLAGESKVLTALFDGEKPNFFPKYQRVKGVSYVGKRTFVFVFDVEGKLIVRNASSSDLISEERTEIEYRIDYFNL